MDRNLLRWLSALCFARHSYTHAHSHHQLPLKGAFTFTLCKGNYQLIGITSLKDTKKNEARKPRVRQRVGAEQGGGPQRRSPHGEHPCCPTPARALQHPSCASPPTCSTAYFYPGRRQEPGTAGAGGSTRLLLLNGGHVGTGSEEAAALVVTAHKGAAELFSGQ